MKSLEIKDKKQLNDYVAGKEHASFLQSWEWGEFQKAVGADILRVGDLHRVGAEDEGKLIAAATFVKRQLPLGRSYFYCPRGPVVDTGVGALNPLFARIEETTKKAKTIFFRFEPLRNITNYPFTEMKFGQMSVIKTADIQPSQTIILDLSPSEEGLLKAMHQKTRYNIRLAEKKGVQIEESPAGDRKNFDSFWELTERTAKRDKFFTHPRPYYEKLLETAPAMFKLFLASREGRVISAGIFCFFGDTVTYLYGASSDEDRQVMAPFLLQWHLICLAKKKGYRYYDFFGIDGKKWPGVTRFKKGFGGQEISYPGTFDVVFDAAHYKIYRFLRRARRLLR